MPQTQDTTPHPVTVYIHGANLSLCYPSMWNVTLEYTATHFNVLGETRPGNPSPTFHTHQFNLMLSWWSKVGSSVESTVPTGSWTRDLWCANPVRYSLAHSDFLLVRIMRCWFIFHKMATETVVTMIYILVTKKCEMVIMNHLVFCQVFLWIPRKICVMLYLPMKIIRIWMVLKSHTSAVNMSTQ